MPSRAKRHPATETARASRAFDLYCALGPDRSLTKLAEQEWQARGKKGDPEKAVKNLRQQFGLWSSAHRWQERVKVYDRQQIERKLRKRAEELEKLNDEQANYGRAMSAIAMTQIKKLMDAHSLNAQAAVQLFKYATDLERLARGAATELTKMEISGDPEGIPVQTENTQHVMVYLPQKDALPQSRVQVEEVRGTE